VGEPRIQKSKTNIREVRMIATPKRERNAGSALGPIRLPIGLFKLGPEAIAESLASKEVSPQGPASGMRVLSFYLSHAGKVLSASRRRDLEKARKLLAARVKQALKLKDGSRVTGIGWK
jgi:tRNA(adenine34) deaminase